MQPFKNKIAQTGLAFLTAGSLLLAGVSTASAQAVFSSLDSSAKTQLNFSGSSRGQPILPGSDVTVSGQGFRAGQAVSLLFGSTAIPGGALTADKDGKVTGKITVPGDTKPGSYPIIVVADAPYNATIAKLKVSPSIPLSGQNNYALTTIELGRGLYQAAYSAKNNHIFVTSAVGRPPVRQSELIKVDANTLKVMARVTPADAPSRPLTQAIPAPAEAARQNIGVFAVYGVAVDDSRGTVWATNTRQNTIAVYKQADLSLVKQFPIDSVIHARDVVVASALNKAYSGATGTPDIQVFDTQSLEAVKTVTIPSTVRGGSFSVASLSLDTQNSRLYVASMSTNEVAVINLKTDEVEKVLAVPGAETAMGVAHDPKTGRIFIASQGSDNLVVLDAEGKVLANTPIGAGALNVVFDPVKQRAYVSNRGAGTIAVTDIDGKIIANLGPAPFANHATLGKAGTIYAVDKSSSTGTSESDSLLRITPRR